MGKSKRIEKETKRLLTLFKDIPSGRKSLVQGLIKRASYMLVTLEVFEADIDEFGYVEQFSQSEKLDSYERTRPVSQLYNTMNKNYQSIIKQLNDLLPVEVEKSIKDEIQEWI